MDTEKEGEIQGWVYGLVLGCVRDGLRGADWDVGFGQHPVKSRALDLPLARFVIHRRTT